MSFDRGRQASVLFGGADGSGINGDTWERNGSTWILRSNSGASPRFWHAMAFDTGRGVTVLFGGAGWGNNPNGETWEWNGTTWTLRSNGGPSPRFLHAMSYDPVRAVTVLFGGDDHSMVLGDTWEWNGTLWTQRATTGPSARSGHAMSYDTARGLSILFGGSGSSDTWEWNGNDWSLTTINGPSPRLSHAMTYDDAIQRIVLFGGTNGGNNYFNDTWELNGTLWTQRATTAPSARSQHAMVHDAARGVAILFGGYDSTGPLDDTWEYGPGAVPTIIAQPHDQPTCPLDNATFSVSVTAIPPIGYQWRRNGVDISNATGPSYTTGPAGVVGIGQYDVIVSNPCGMVTSSPATLSILSDMPALQYQLGILCPGSAIAGPGLFGFTDDGLAANAQCAGQRSFRLFAGRQNSVNGKVWRVRQNCTVQQFGPVLCSPDSVMVDVHGRWPLYPIPLANLVIAGGCDYSISFINPSSGGVIETFSDTEFGHIGQMAIDSIGRLFVGSVNRNSLNVIDMGAVEPFYTAPGLSPRAVTLDLHDTVYLTCAGDGVMRKIDPFGNVINQTFATGLTGAVSQAMAPHGIFHGNIFVACGDRVMEVDFITGASSTFLSCHAVSGIGFDPEGYMYLSEPTLNRIVKIGPGLPGDMNGDGVVNLADLPGFVAAIMQTPTAPLPILTADLNGDGCSDGADVQPFLEAFLGP